MGEAIAVGVSVRGLPIAASLPLRDARLEGGRWSGFVETDAALPVGTAVTLKLPGGAPAAARVERVVEAEVAQGGGMALSFEAEADAALRDALGIPVSAGDPAAAVPQAIEPEGTKRGGRKRRTTKLGR